MGFGDLKSDSGLQNLDAYLSDKSYIEGYVPSQADLAVFNAVNGPPVKYRNALRWYKHIASYSEEERLAFPPALGQCGSCSSEAKAAADDDNFDLFGSEDEEDSKEQERLKQERLAEYAAKKASKPALVAKSNIIMQVKPWDDETSMTQVEEKVRSIQTDGLVWGASKLVPIAFGIKALQITCVVEDDKVGTDFLEESITAFEDLVQSVDIIAFNKV